MLLNCLNSISESSGGDAKFQDAVNTVCKYLLDMDLSHSSLDSEGLIKHHCISFDGTWMCHGHKSKYKIVCHYKTSLYKF